MLIAALPYADYFTCRAFDTARHARDRLRVDGSNASKAMSDLIAKDAVEKIKQ